MCKKIRNDRKVTIEDGDNYKLWARKICWECGKFHNRMEKCC